MIENKKVVTRSLISLFLGLSIIYSLTYMKKIDLFKNSSQKLGNISTNLGNKELDDTTEKNGLNYVNSVDLSNYHSNSSGEKKVGGSVSLGEVLRTNEINNSDTPNYYADEVFTTSDLSINNIKTLPGTTEYFGVLDIINILGEDPKITLEDNRGNYFVYYGNHLDFIDTIEILGGNVYEMKTEREILENQLFGDKVSYINLSIFKDVWVIMVIQIDNDVRLLQIPANKYHQSKEYLKSLFIQ